jgi:hypothetical protein
LPAPALKNILTGYAKQAQAPGISAIMRLLFRILLCVLGAAQASAQNVVSEELLVLTADERNAAFTRLLQTSNEKCDRVVRTLFKGTSLGLVA